MSRCTPLTLPVALGMLAASLTVLADPPTYHVTPLMNGSTTVAEAINNSGQVVGYSFPLSNQSHAFFYDGTMHDLGTFGGTDSKAYAINASGTISGNFTATGSSSFQAFSYNGTVHDLGPVAGSFSSAYGVNDSGLVVGLSVTANGSHAFSYDGTLHDLGTLGGRESNGLGVNASGEVVGYSDTSLVHNSTDAFLYDGTMHDLGRLTGTFALDTAINNGGLSVGYASLAGDVVTHATFFDGGAFDLNNYLDASGAGWELDYATGINDLGQIVGYGSLNGNQASFLLTPDATPTPEPGAYALGGAFLLMLAAGDRRRRRDRLS